MTTKLLKTLLLFLVLIFAQNARSQEIQSPDLKFNKIKGVRFMPYLYYRGLPFLSNEWQSGKIEFTTGEIADSLNLVYSSFKDELIYYNKTLSAQIMIDKASLNGFWLTEKNGTTHQFRKQYYNGFSEGDRFFEVLSSGETDLLVYRKVELNTSILYKDEKGALKNMAYDPSYQYYFYSPKKGYTFVRLNKNSLLSKFNKQNQKPIKKLLRKNSISVNGEENFVRAWKIIEKEGFKVLFQEDSPQTQKKQL
jgi:hypothetical protein